jgi:uncharacterized protein (DUF1499 family)
MTPASEPYLPRLLTALLLTLTMGWFWLLPAAPAEAGLLHLAGPLPSDLGLHGGSLTPCATPAHCARADWPVSDPEAALAALMPAVLALEGVEIVDTHGGYLHATATSRLFGFVDDLELFADPAAGVLQARSVSRLGDSDLGVNARRLETLHRALTGT